MLRTRFLCVSIGVLPERCTASVLAVNRRCEFVPVVQHSTCEVNSVLISDNYLGVSSTNEASTSRARVSAITQGPDYRNMYE